MTPELMLAYFVLCATLMRALAVRAKVVTPRCSRCGHVLERRALGETICSCEHARPV